MKEPTSDLRQSMADHIVRMTLTSARRDGWLISQGTHGDLADAISPWIFAWALTDEQQPRHLTVTSDEDGKWNCHWIDRSSELRVIRPGLSKEQERWMLANKSADPRSLASPYYASGTDERSRFKRWTALRREGIASLEPTMARRLVCAWQLQQLLHQYVHATDSFPLSVDEMNAYGIGLINVSETSSTESADILLSWDGEQAYLISTALTLPERHEVVLYFDSLGEPAPISEPRAFGDSGATYQLSNESSRQGPKFIFDQYVGRAFAPLAAWNLVDPGDAINPLE